MSPAPVLIMAGGTGGHVFPALAVARELRGRNETVVWLGTRQGLEARIVPAEGIVLETVRVSGLRRKGLGAWIAAPWQLLIALADALSGASSLVPVPGLPVEPGPVEPVPEEPGLERVERPARRRGESPRGVS